jgi:hypothetical protein
MDGDVKPYRASFPPGTLDAISARLNNKTKGGNVLWHKVITYHC